jgi:UDP-galactopyranose mutase
MFDYLIVGAGFAGAVAAERLARGLGKKVMVVDKRCHVAGNAYDHLDQSGILVHKYGPHIFHTNSEEIFTYLSSFTTWRRYEHRVLASVDGKLVPVPINLDTVNRLTGKQLSSESLERYFQSVAEQRDQIRNSEDVVVSRVGRDLYEKLFRGYTRKQWGLDPSQLDPAVLARIPVRTNRDDRYFTDAFQAMPRNGFTQMFQTMLDHPNIHVVTNCDYRDAVKSIRYREMIYTGPVDEFFDYRFGKLPYRSLRFQHETVDTDILQPVAVINFPNDHSYTRITEFKHLTGQKHSKTSVVYEYPSGDGDPYYPVPRPENAELYAQYQVLAAEMHNVHFTGRLATYKYYNMDQVVGQSLALCAKLSGKRRADLTAHMQSAKNPTTQCILPTEDAA